MSTVIVWDIDGTVSDSNWRLHMIKEKPKNWPAFIKASQQDKPIEQTQFLFQVLTQIPNVLNVFMTARGEGEREITTAWLKKNHMFSEHLYMRQAKDNRPDWEVKSEMLDTIEETHGKVFMAFEDRPGVLTGCYHKKGIFVLDVGNGTAT